MEKQLEIDKLKLEKAQKELEEERTRLEEERIRVYMSGVRFYIRYNNTISESTCQRSPREPRVESE